MFKQVELKYDYNALEPHIDEMTMITHYTKHHAAYTANLNNAIAKLDKFAGKDIEFILKNIDKIPDDATKNAVRNNGGGFYNHNLYFSIMSPNGGGEPTGKLAERINKDFGSFDALVAEVSSNAVARFGSGWSWLSAKADGSLVAGSSPNQDNPLIEGSDAVPILGIDVWEHAYYLKYKNVRPDYIKAFWNVVDWNEVSRLYEAIIS